MSDMLTTIRTSRIHGLGLFAWVDISEGVCVGEYTGELLTAAEANVRFADEPDCCFACVTYQFELSDDAVIDGGVGGGNLRYVNHSATPNCIVARSSNAIYFIAKRMIAAGEELTIDYDCDCDDCLSAQEHAA